jgi:hypothetical protein
MSETRNAYFCYTCSEGVTFRGTRIRYNLDGSLHLCKPEDKLAYEKYHEYIRREDFWTGWRLTGEDFWKWKREIYDVQRWTQSRDYYNELKEQREHEQQRAAEAEAEERRKAAEAEAQRRKAAEEAAKAQRREEQRKQASREKRRAARKRRKQKAAQEQARKGRKQSRSRSRSRTPHDDASSYESRALWIMELTHDIFTLPFKEAEAVIKNKFRTLALKFHPDRKSGDTAKFREMIEAKEYLMRRCTG